MLFADSDPALMAGLLQGIHGKPVDEGQRMWRDKRHGTMLLYRPTGR